MPNVKEIAPQDPDIKRIQDLPRGTMVKYSVGMRFCKMVTKGHKTVDLDDGLENRYSPEHEFVVLPKDTQVTLTQR